MFDRSSDAKSSLLAGTTNRAAPANQAKSAAPQLRLLEKLKVRANKGQRIATVHRFRPAASS